MDQIIIYNPRDGAEINDIYAQKMWKHKVNTIRKYPQSLAEYLLSKYGFLRKVLPKDLPEIKKTMVAQYECDYPDCNYVTDTEQKLKMHKLGKHKLTQEVKEAMEGIKSAEPVGDIVPKDREKLSPEEQAGIPNTKRGEVDGWYGRGWEVDSGMMKATKPGKTPGHFKG